MTVCCAAMGPDDNSITARLGTSPGASTAAFIAVPLIKNCFASRLTDAGWLPRRKRIIPAYGTDRKAEVDACCRPQADTAPDLGLHII